MAQVLLKGVLVLALISLVTAGPMRYEDDGQPTTECSTTCDLSGPPKYSPGQTYEYSYEATIVTSIPGATEQESHLRMSSQLQLQVLNPCELALQLTDVSLEDRASSRDRYQFVDRAMEFKRALQEKPLRFSFQDGKIEAVCPEENEETWVLNIKRGIISHIQNSMPHTESNMRIRETDINGECETSYEVLKKGWGNIVIKKSADLIGCYGRQSFDTVLQGTPYRVPSRLQSLPIIKSELECEQTMTGDGHASSVVCNEEHKFRPFSSEATGAMSKITTKLTLLKTSASTRISKGKVMTRKSLIFENKMGMDDQDQSRREVKGTIQKLCDQTQTDIRPETPGLFHTLIKQMWKLDVDSLSAIHRSVAGGKMCDKAEKFFRDAIPVVHNTASVSFIKDLTIRGEVKDTELDVWMTSLAFISKPSVEMLENVKPLIEMPEPNRKVSMAVSSLVHSYCRENEACEDKSIVKEIISVFQKNLRYNCKTSNEKEYETVMMSLKALGNTGHAEDAADALGKCFNEEENSMEIRIAAISAFRRMACTAQKDDLMELFENPQKDSELRIGAYLAMMHCPTPDILRHAQKVLEKEEINQVGSFVWTHLTNLMESSCPLKKEIREILENTELKKEFDIDKRKFSRNIEWSLFSEMLNTGAMVESNVIWSTKSFIPRSANLNLTVDMFGESVNLLEIGGRAEGLDSILEKLFNKEDNSVDREKRDLIRKPHINRLDRMYKPDRPDTPQGSYFLRVFGNEIRYDDLQGLDLSSIKDKFNFLEWLVELSREHDFDFTKSISFLDTTMKIPTMAGLPFTLSVDGSAVIDVKIKGKLDLRNLGTAPRSVDIQGSIAPSAAVEITGEMGVDAFVARSAIRRSSTMHTSTLADGKIEVKQGKIFKMDINMPRDKVELLDAKTSKICIYHRGKCLEQKMPSVPRISGSKCIEGNLVRALGVRVCASGSMPSLKSNTWRLPVLGPMEGSLVLEKRDTFSGMHYEAKFLEDKVITDNGPEITDILKISYNTPGSQYDREFTVDFTLNRNQKAMRLNLRTPWKKADFTGSLVNMEDLKRFTSSAIIDDAKEYSMTAEMQVESNKYNTKYIPMVELTIPSRTLGRLDGEVTYKPNKKIDIDLSIKELTRTPMSVRGGILVKDKGQRHDIDLAVKLPRFSGDMGGFIERVPGTSLGTQTTVNYQIDSGSRESFTINKKWTKTNKGDLEEYSINGGVSTSRWPDYNSDYQMTLAKTGRQSVSLSLEGGVGQSSANRLTLTASATDNTSKKNKAYEAFMRFKLPVKNLAYEMSLQHTNKANELKTKGSLKYGPRQEAVIDISAKKQSSKPLKMQAEASLHYPGREFMYIQSVEEKSPNEYHHDLDITLAKYQKIGLTSVYKSQPRHELTASLNLPDTSPINIEGHLNPDLQNLQSGLMLGYNDKRWGGDASVIYNRDRKDGSASTKVNIMVPSRHIKAEGEASKSSKTASSHMMILWDADRDTSKKIDTTGEIVLSAVAPKMAIKTTWPGNFFEMKANGKNDKKGWWAVERDLEGTVSVKSSISPLEDLSLSFVHDQTPASIKTQVESSWAPGKMVKGDLMLKKDKDWSKLDTAVTATTSFKGFRTLEGKVNYNLQDSTFEGKVSAKKEDAEISLETSGSMNLQGNRDLKGSIALATPFRGYKQISVDGSHRDDGRAFNSQLTANWGAGQTAGMIFNMNHGRRGWSVTNNGDFTVSTPFNGYESNKMIWTHQNDAGSIKTHIEGETARGKSIFDMDANHKNNRNKRAIDMTATLRTPFKHARDMRWTLTHQNDKSSWENIKTTAMAQWAPGKAIQVENTAGYRAGQSVMKNMKITTPFKGYEFMTLDIDSRLDGNTYTSHKEIKWGKNKKITIDGSWTNKGYEFESEMRLTSPFEMAERLVLMASNKKEGAQWATAASMDYAPEKKIELATKVGLKAKKVLFVNLKSPCPYFKDFMIDLEHSGELRDFDTKVEMKYDPYFDTISASAMVDTANIKAIKAKLDIETPFRKMRMVRALLSHKKTGRYDYKSYITYEVPRHKFSASHDLTLKSKWDYSCHSEIEYNQDKLGELDVSWKFDPKFSGNINGKVYNTPLSPLGIMLSHNGDSKDFKNNAVIEWKNKKIAAGTEWKWGDNGIMATTSLSTPFRPLKNLDIELKHSGDWKQFNSDVSMELNGKRSTISGEGKINNNQLEGRFELTNPYQGSLPGTVALTFNHSGKWKNFRNTASLELGSRRIGTSSEFSLKGTNLKGTITLQLPEEYSLIVNHKGDWTDFTNGLIIRLDKDEIRGNGVFKLDGSKLETSLNVRTPYKSFRVAGIEVSHEGNLDNFKTDAKVKTPFRALPTAEMSVSHNGALRDHQNSFTLNLAGKKFAGNSRMSQIGDSVDASGGLETPYEDYDRFSYSLNHRGELNDFTSTAGIETPFKRLKRATVNVNHKGNLRNFDSSARIESSYPGWESTAVSAKHATTRQGFKSSGSIETPFDSLRTVKANVVHHGGWPDVSTSGELETSVPGYERFAGSLSHNTDSGRHHSTASIELPFRGYEKFDMDLNHEGSLKDFSAAGNLKTSVAGYEKFGIKVNNNMEDKGVDSSVTIETPFKGLERLMTSLQHSGTVRNFQTAAAVETPISGYERFAVNLEHKGHLGDFSSSGSLDTPFRGYDRFSGNLKHKGSLRNFETSGHIETPMRHYKRVSGSVKHRGDLRDFETSAGMEMPKHRFSGTLKHKGTLNDFETSGSATSSLSGYERVSGSFKHRGDAKQFETSGLLETSIPKYERMAVNINHDSRRAVASSGSVETSIPGYDRFDWDINHKGNKKGFTSSAKVNTPIRGYDRFGLNIKHAGKNWRDFSTQVKAKTPVRGYETFGMQVNHQGDLNDFKTSAKLDTPFETAPVINLNVNHQGDLNAFSSSGSMDWAGKTIEGNANMRTSGGWWQHDHTATVSLKTPFKPIRNMNLNVEHAGGNGAWNGKVTGMLNDYTHVDADYSLDTGRRKTVDLSMRKPKPLTINIDKNDERATAAVNWDPSSADSNVRMEAGLKNAGDKKEVSMKLDLPSRSVAALASMEKSAEKWAQKAEVQWDSSPSKKLGYDIEMSKSRRGQQKILDGMLKFTSPRIKFEMTGNNVAVPGKRYTTEIALQTKDRLVIKHELTTSWPSFRDQLTISHPRFSRNAVLTTEGIVELDKVNLDGKINLRYEDESIDFTGKIADESSASNKHYRAGMTLRHPNSQFDFSYLGSVQSSDDVNTVQSEVNYLCSHDRQMKTFALRSEINKLKEEIKLELESPKTGDVSVSGRRSSYAGARRYEVVSAYAGRSSRMDMSLDRSKPAAEIKISDHQDNTLHIYGKYLDPNHLSLKAYHTSSGSDVDDAELSLMLTDEGHVLRARAYLRPDIITDLKDTVRGDYSWDWEDLKREMSDEWRMKKPALSRLWTPVSDAALSVHSDMSDTYRMVSADVRRMYRSNEFYLRDMYDAAADAYAVISFAASELMDKASRAVEYYKEYMAEMKETLCEYMSRFKRELHMTLGMFWEGLKISINELSQKWAECMSAKWEAVKDWSSRSAPWLSESMDKARRTYKQWSMTLSDWIKEKSDWVQNHPTVRGLMDKMAATQRSMRQWKDEMWRRVDSIKDRYNELKDEANDRWRQAQKHPHVKKAVGMAKDAWDKTQWAIKYTELDNKAREAWGWMKDQSLETAKDKALKWTKDYLRTDKSRVTVWDPRAGDFQIEVYLPVAMRDLKSLPKVDVKKYIVKVKNFIEKYMPEDLYMWDYYYTYLPSRDVTNWVPPYKAHATLAGKQHYMTFDKHFYEFEGQCSYLLARDFIDGKFAVVVNYENGPVVRKTISVMLGDQQVEISPGYKVLLDGQRVEMPQHFAKTTILREGSSIIVRNENGIKVTCNLPRDRCTVDVSGWYFAKTAGMLGTYNNEPADDYTNPDGSWAATPEELAEKWTVGRSCNTVNKATRITATPDSHRYRLCATLFKEASSSFRPCFKQVSPESFMQMCLNELPASENRMMQEQDMCGVASFYVDECKRAGVPIYVPSACVSCDLPGGSKQLMGDDRKLEGDEIPESADIVIVMSHGMCNEELKPDLPTLVTNINKALKEEGFKDNRFALIGYGGKTMSEPHIHTMQGEIFGDQSKFNLALDNFDFEDGTEEDSMAALYYVSTKLRFRPAVSKSIILIPCATCSGAGMRYADVQDLMLRRDLALHVLMEHEFRVKAKSPKTSYIFGVDSESMFTEKDYGKLKGDSELRDFVITPKDFCVALSEETDGSVFNINKMKSGKAFIQKKFRDVFSLMVAEKAEPADCQICDCVADEVGIGKSVCRPCEIRSPIYKYLPNFGGEDEYDDSSSLSDSSSSESQDKSDIVIKPPKKLKNKKTKKIKTKKPKTKPADKRRLRKLNKLKKATS